MEAVTTACIDEARDDVMMGVQRKSMIMSDEEKKLTAYHEGTYNPCTFDDFQGFVLMLVACTQVAMLWWPSTPRAPSPFTKPPSYPEVAPSVWYARYRSLSP